MCKRMVSHEVAAHRVFVYETRHEIQLKLP